MALGVDLRKLHIKTEDDAMEFLNIIESKIPQLKQVFKNSKMKQQSLVNRVRFEQEQGAKARAHVVQPSIDPNASVSERLTGKAVIVEDKAASRLEQLRAVQPGEIGKLDVPVEQTKVPKEEVKEVEVNNDKVEAVAKQDKEVEKTKPSSADTTPVGKMIAKKTGGKVEKKLK